MPGLIVTQHSGSGKANQFFLRGFNLDHGTDFSASVEGVPMNLPTHAHGQGWLDLNFLIPELIEQVSFDKGPYDASGGNFSTAGSARIRLVRRLDRGIAKASGGTDNSLEGLFANSTRVARGDLLYAGKVLYYDGPWDNPENSALLSGLVTYSAGTASNGYSVSAMGYRNTWDATDQVARRAVDQGEITRLGSLDPTDGGSSGRYTLAGTWRNRRPGMARTQATAYAAYYHLNLFSNFTYFLDDPVLGDQFEQADRRLYARRERLARVVHGVRRAGQRQHRRRGPAPRRDPRRRPVQHECPRARRHDPRRRGRRDQPRRRTSRTRRDGRTGSASTVGVRADAFRFDVRSDIGANSGVETALIASPKASLAFGPWRRDGALPQRRAGLPQQRRQRRHDHGSTPPPGCPSSAVDPVVRTRGAEIGARTAAVSGLQSTLSLWYLGLDSELVFVGDAGGTEASGASEHVGVEFNNYYAAADWLEPQRSTSRSPSRATPMPARARTRSRTPSAASSPAGSTPAGRPGLWRACRCGTSGRAR